MDTFMDSAHATACGIAMQSDNNNTQFILKIIIYSEKRAERITY